MPKKKGKIGDQCYIPEDADVEETIKELRITIECLQDQIKFLEGLLNGGKKEE